MMMSIICMLLAAGGKARRHFRCSGRIILSLMCIKGAKTLFACSSGTYLPPGGYFFEMEATASI
jgi:hypothetical protein